MTPNKPRRKGYRFKLIQDGMTVAGVDAPTLKAAKQEIMHYAMVYSEDGPVKIVRTR